MNANVLRMHCADDPEAAMIARFGDVLHAGLTTLNRTKSDMCGENKSETAIYESVLHAMSGIADACSSSEHPQRLGALYFREATRRGNANLLDIFVLVLHGQTDEFVLGVLSEGIRQLNRRFWAAASAIANSDENCDGNASASAIPTLKQHRTNIIFIAKVFDDDDCREQLSALYDSQMRSDPRDMITINVINACFRAAQSRHSDGKAAAKSLNDDVRTMCVWTRIVKRTYEFSAGALQNFNTICALGKLDKSNRSTVVELAMQFERLKSAAEHEAIHAQIEKQVPSVTLDEQHCVPEEHAMQSNETREGESLHGSESTNPVVAQWGDDEAQKPSPAVSGTGIGALIPSLLRRHVPIEDRCDTCSQAQQVCFQPCGHVVFCAACAWDKKTCPICEHAVLDCTLVMCITSGLSAINRTLDDSLVRKTTSGASDSGCEDPQDELGFNTIITDDYESINCDLVNVWDAYHLSLGTSAYKMHVPIVKPVMLRRVYSEGPPSVTIPSPPPSPLASLLTGGGDMLRQ